MPARDRRSWGNLEGFSEGHRLPIGILTLFGIILGTP